MSSPKSNAGCWILILKIVAIVAALFLLEYLFAMLFHNIYPPDEITRAFIPFQNHFFATTDAFLTNETMSGEFTDDITSTGRFLVNSLLVLAVAAILGVVLYIIPYTNKHLSKIWFSITIPALLFTMFHSSCRPGTKTVFDRERSTVTISRYDYGFFIDKRTISFADIREFKYKIHKISGHGHDSDRMYADVFAIVGNEEVFIAENEVGIKATENESWSLPADKEKEVEDLLIALRTLTAKK